MSSPPESSRASTSSDDDDDYEIDEAALRRAQMKRNAKTKGQTSKLLMKFKNIMTPEERERSNMMKRIDMGLRAVLQLHSPVELSSICGVLGLKPLERGPASIEQIVQYCKDEETHEFSELLIMRAVNCMWEGALFEYLKSVGHPMTTAFADPKLTLMKIWRRGGFSALKDTTFTPHYICRRVENRSEWETSEDVMKRIRQMLAVENQLKRTEREVFEEHDYTNILYYFQQLHELRALELKFREFMVQEVEKARAAQSRAESNVGMANMMLRDCENAYMAAADDLNAQLAACETAGEAELAHRMKLNGELYRLRLASESVMDDWSHIRDETQLNNPYIMCDLEHCHRDVVRVHQCMQEVRHTAAELQQEKRRIAATHADEISYLNSQIGALQEQIRQRDSHIHSLEDSLGRAVREVKFCAKKLVRMKVETDAVRESAWASTLRWSSKVNMLERRIGSLYDVIEQGMSSENPTAISLCLAVNNVLMLHPPDRLTAIRDTMLMQHEDEASTLERAAYLQMLLEMQQKESKNKKKKGGSVKGKKSPSKSTKGSTKSNGGSKPGTADSKKKPGTADSSASKKKKGGDDSSRISKSSKKSDLSPKKGKKR